MNASASHSDSQFLTFFLDGDLCGISILSIKEIKEYTTITRIPMMPNFISGVMNLRGSVVPVIDLSVRFGKKKISITKKTCIVIVEIDTIEAKMDIGVIVDSVSEVIEIKNADISQPPSFGSKIRIDFIQGIAKTEDKFVILLDTAKVFSLDELSYIHSVSDNYL